MATCASPAAARLTSSQRSELRQLAKIISDDPVLNTSPSRANIIYIDEDRRRIVVGTRRGVTSLRRALRRYRSVVTVLKSPKILAIGCRGRSRCESPLRGGIHMLNPLGRFEGASRDCTFGFAARGPQGDVMVSAGTHSGGLGL